MNVKGGKWSKFRLLRQRIIKFLIAEYNKLKNEAIFEDDYKRMSEYKQAIDFMSAYNNNMYHWTCPMCGSRLFIQGVVHDVDLDSEKYKDYPQYDTHEHYDTLHISKCQKCGWYTIDEL